MGGGKAAGEGEQQWDPAQATHQTGATAALGPTPVALQARLADATKAKEEVTALATFLGVSVPAGMTFPLSPTFGDTSVLTSEQVLRTC